MAGEATGKVSTESITEYHADFEYVGNSGLKVYRASPARYFAMFVERSMPRPPPTPPQILGQLTHTLVLQRELFNQIYLIANDCKVRRGKAWEAFDQAAAEEGQQAVLPDQVDLARAMAAAVLAHPAAHTLLLDTPGIAEQSIRWTDPSGVRCKCRPDWLISEKRFEHLLCIDLKTSATPDPEGFGKQAENLGYFNQAALYLTGCASIHPDRPSRFIFIVVGNEPPHDVFCYVVPPADIHDAELENVDTLCRLATSQQTNVWRLPDQDKLQELERPRWARRRMYDE